MAIETKYIYSPDHSGVLAWLNENAVPEYFDKVEADTTTASTVNCYVGDLILLKMTVVSYGTRYTITNAAGSERTVNNTYQGAYVNYGYKCKGGLALAIGIETQSAFVGLFITKDTAGNTTIVAGSSAVGSFASAATATAAVDMVTKSLSFSQTTGEATTIVPFACGNAAGECRYTPNAFYMPTVQTQAAGRLVIDGVEYISNGVWALKDEEIGGGGASGDYASKAEFNTLKNAVNAHTSDTDNPHKVTAAQVPLAAEGITAGNVQAAFTELAEFVAASKNSAFGIGETIVESGDLNLLTTPGVYYSPTATITATLLNCPTKAYAFRLETKIVIPGRYLQMLYPNSAGVFYMRSYLTAGWSNWYKFSGEELVTE